VTDRLLVIGEAPSDEGPPLEGRVAYRISEYAGITVERYLELTDRHNLFPFPIPFWSHDHAKQNAIDVWPQLVGRRTLLLGKNVTLAFGLHPPDLLLSWRSPILELEVAMLPHPSGRNTWWNEPTNRAAARRFLHTTFGVEL